MTDPLSHLDELLAQSMDAEPELLDLLPELFAGVEVLGVHPADVLSLLAAHPLDETDRVLDLGCGKGAVGLALADRFGCTVHGVDGMPAFVDHAEAQAAARGLTEQTLFACADLVEVQAQSRDYDLVLLLGMAGIFGGPAETVAALRSVLRPGGRMIFDEAFLAAEAPAKDDYQDCLGEVELRAAMLRGGEELLAEGIIDGPEMHDWYREQASGLAARATALAERHPRRAALLREFAARHEQALDLLDDPLTGALWLLRRPESAS